MSVLLSHDCICIEEHSVNFNVREACNDEYVMYIWISTSIQKMRFLGQAVLHVYAN